jgi:hypothetical protein
VGSVLGFFSAIRVCYRLCLITPNTTEGATEITQRNQLSEKLFVLETAVFFRSSHKIGTHQFHLFTDRNDEE